MLNRHALVKAAALIGLAACLLGCSENNVSLFVRHVPIPNPEDNCAIEIDPEGESYPAGKLDKAFRPAYDRVLLLGNQLQPRGDAETLKPETSQVQLYEAEVTVFDVAGNELISYTHPTAGFIDQAQGSLPGYGLVQVTMLPPEVTSVFDTSTGVGYQLVSRVRVFGSTLGGTEVNSGSWDWPIFLCETTASSSCIGGFEPEDTEAPVIPRCPDGQDERVDIRLLQSVVACKGPNPPATCP